MGTEGVAVMTPARAGAAREELSWVNRLAGRFVVFEGPDGSGKTTQYRRFADLARARGLTVCEVREPGGTAISERIRDVLLDVNHDEMSVRCETLLYMASRAQLVAERIVPALRKNELVLADRFVSSTLAYQGAAGGMSETEIMHVAEVACGDVWPDLVVIFDVDEQTAAHRMGLLLDRMEAKGAAFHQRVRAGYKAQAEREPGRHLLIDARPGEDAVEREFLRELEGWVGERLG
ncbi:MAG: dTMP kinase [Phycisphaeraceae bacterium]|nr:dTMP kinase [Phycisphaeraceae bacterium]MCB9847186.1 dTMP kinase [Phycisphaeraceae bacterium]